MRPYVAITAAHLLDLRPFDDKAHLWPYRWSAETGESGRLLPDGKLLALDRDIGIAFSTRRFPAVAALAREAPRSGTRVWAVGYDWRDRQRAHGQRVWTSRVTRVVADHVITDDDVDAGTSGSCVYDEQGRAIGIVAVILETQQGTPSDPWTNTRIVGIWGDLLDEYRAELPEGER